MGRKKNFGGIWFIGLAGSGKTFASEICSLQIKNSFIIDGDEVREFISFDLGYTEADRSIQITRVLGVAKIAQKNQLFPIMSTVTMTKEVFNECKLIGVKVVELIRPMYQLRQVRKIYDSAENVVGKHIQQVHLDTVKIQNEGNKKFELAIKEFVK